MNKQDLIDQASERAEVNKKEARAIIDALFAPANGVIADAIASGEDVMLTGFGKFERRHRKAREARNPATGESVAVPAHHVPAFKPGAGLKEAVRG